MSWHHARMHACTHALIHSCMHTYIYIYLRLFQRTTLPARSTSRMHEHAARTSITYCIDFLTQSPLGRAERYYFFQVLALSHRAQVLNLEPHVTPARMICVSKRLGV